MQPENTEWLYDFSVSAARNTASQIGAVLFALWLSGMLAALFALLRSRLTLHALEAGVITPERSLLSWDGQAYAHEVWNADQTLESAMAASATWYFQALDSSSGLPAIRDFVRSIGYGNLITGSDTASYWYDSTLRISPVEQVEMLQKLYENTLLLCRNCAGYPECRRSRRRRARFFRTVRTGPVASGDLHFPVIGDNADSQLLCRRTGSLYSIRPSQIYAEIAFSLRCLGEASKPGIYRDTVFLSHSGFSVNGKLSFLFCQHDLFQPFYGFSGGIPVLAEDPFHHPCLLYRGNFQGGFDPEAGQRPVAVVGIQPALPVGDVTVSIPEPIQPLLHPFFSDLIRHFPEIPDAGGAKRILKADISVPLPVPERFPAPPADGMLRIDHAVLKRQQGGNDLERGAG